MTTYKDGVARCCRPASQLCVLRIIDSEEGLAQREHDIRLDRQLWVISDEPIVLPVGHLDEGRRLVQLI